MDWTKLEGFDEKFAKVRIREHKKFGGKVIEVLYGAKDENGNPVMPQENVNDGHGRWFGIDVNGEKRVFSLQKPGESEVEYTTDSKENALEDMENAIQEKQSLCKEATELFNNDHVDNFEEAYNVVLEKWNALKDWATPKEEELKRRFDEIKAEYDAMQASLQENIAAKQAIVDEAKTLAESTEWKKANEKFNQLRNELFDIDRAGAKGKELEKEFRALQNQFQANRKKYFAELDENRGKAKEKKEELIAKAKDVLQLTNFKSASDKMVSLMNEWKKAGSAGHAVDEELWSAFNGVRNEFYEKRQSYFEERKEAFDQSISAKKALIEEAKAIAEEKDYSKEKTNRMKALDQEWRKAGYSGKDENDSLWDEFTKAKEVFWAAKREDNQRRFQEIIDRKSATIKKLRDEIEELGVKEYETDVYDQIRSIQRRIEEKKEIVASLEEDIKDLKGKLEPKE